MEYLVSALLLLFTTVGSQANKSLNHSVKSGRLQYIHDDICPTWFICDTNEKILKCGNGHNYAVVCDKERQVSAILDCHCVTYDQNTASTFLGACYYNCEHLGKIKKRDNIYTKLPKLPEVLINESSCTPFHRTGLLCGDCEDEHSPLVLSYNLTCVKCPDGHKNWWKFILVAFVPLTFFYLFVVVFNINVTSSRLHGVVWFSQAMASPVFVRLVILASNHSNKNLSTVVKVLVVFYSFWNLDVFRSVIPEICLNVTTLQALALDFLVAVYPFALILFSYIIIELYDRKCIVIVAIWKPFHKVLTLFRESWDIRTSVIDSFSAFFLLSHIKIISVCTDILTPTVIYKLGSNRSTLGLYYTPSVEYLGHEHLPYAILGITLLVIFVCIPILTLIFYPFQFFQKFLSLFPFNWHFLRAFVDSYQGWYKDGTEPGTLDCRWFSTVILIIRSIFFITHGSTLSILFFMYASIILVIFLIALVNIQPFKTVDGRHSSTDAIFSVLLCLCYICILGRDVANTEENKFGTIMVAVAFLTMLVPIVYTILLISFWLVTRARKIRC